MDGTAVLESVCDECGGLAPFVNKAAGSVVTCRCLKHWRAWMDAKKAKGSNGLPSRVDYPADCEPK